MKMSSLVAQNALPLLAKQSRHRHQVGHNGGVVVVGGSAHADLRDGRRQDERESSPEKRTCMFLRGDPNPEIPQQRVGSALDQIVQVLPSRAAEAVDQDGVAEGPLLPVILHHVRHKVHHRFQAEMQKKNHEQARQSK